MPLHNLAGIYLNGLGVPKDVAESLKWMTKAAEQGLAAAQHNLGVIYYNGIGVQRNYQEAHKWFLLAAKQGLSEAFLILATMYDQGQGVRPDLIEGHKWIVLAANFGNKEAARRKLYNEASMEPNELAEAESRVKAFAAGIRDKTD